MRAATKPLERMCPQPGCQWSTAMTTNIWIQHKVTEHLSKHHRYYVPKAPPSDPIRVVKKTQTGEATKQGASPLSSKTTAPATADPLPTPMVKSCFCHLQKVCTGYLPEGEYCMYEDFWREFNASSNQHEKSCIAQEKRHLSTCENKKKLYVTTEDKSRGGIHIANHKGCIGYLPQGEYDTFSRFWKNFKTIQNSL